jgi:hypothetical protein
MWLLLYWHPGAFDNWGGLIGVTYVRIIVTKRVILIIARGIIIGARAHEKRHARRVIIIIIGAIIWCYRGFRESLQRYTSR